MQCRGGCFYSARIIKREDPGNEPFCIVGFLRILRLVKFRPVGLGVSTGSSFGSVPQARKLASAFKMWRFPTIAGIRRAGIFW